MERLRQPNNELPALLLRSCTFHQPLRVDHLVNELTDRLILGSLEECFPIFPLWVSSVNQAVYGIEKSVRQISPTFNRASFNLSLLQYFAGVLHRSTSD